jgi:hypothetical protein
VNDAMRVKKRRRKPKVSKEELKEVAEGLGKLGEMLEMLGKIAGIDKELKKTDRLMNKLFRADPTELFAAVEEDYELSAKLASFVTKLAMLASIMEKNPMEMTPDEQIEAGKGLKEFSGLLKEMAECMEETENE